MAVPKRRVSNSRSGMRRSHQHIKPSQTMYCPRCEQQIKPHCVCSNCGFYRGRDVLKLEDKE